MELKDTIKDMNRTDYKRRFIAEYRQVYIRRKKLSKTITDYMNNKLKFEPDTPIGILMSQCAIMDAYLAILKHRALIENIDLL
jgi:hypothetical protein